MAKKKTTSKSKSRDVLVVASKVKNYVKAKKMNTSSEAVMALSEQVYNMLDSATERTKANGRKTLKAQDL